MLGKRKYSEEVLKSEPGEEYIVAGWVDRVRDLGGIRFLVLRDREGKIQITAPTGEVKAEVFDKLGELRKDYVIVVKGKLKKSREAPGGKEIIPKELKVVSKAELPLPLEYREEVESKLPTKIKYRYLDLRNPRSASIFKIRGKAGTGFRRFFEGNDFIEIQTSKIVPSATEEGATVFPVVYFEEEAFLAQSPQFYKQMMMATGFDKVYEIGPVFRAEPHKTSRHVSEYTSIDFEQAFIEGYEDIMETLENAVQFVIQFIKSNCEEELKELGVEPEVPSVPFPRITFREAQELVSKRGKELEAADLDPEAERILGKIFKEKHNSNFVFITKFPWEKRPFYTKRSKEDPELTESFDLLYKGLELTTGGQREEDLKTLREQAKEKDIPLDKIDYYLDFFRYGMPPHGGTGTGLGRFIKQLLNLKNIKEAILLPRTPKRKKP